MPVYEYIDEQRGITVEEVRPVERRDEPLTITLRRKTVPTRIGLVAGGLVKEPTFKDTLRKAYHAREQELGSRFRPQHNVKTIRSTLDSPV